MVTLVAVPESSDLARTLFTGVSDPVEANTPAHPAGPAWLCCSLAVADELVCRRGQTPLMRYFPMHLEGFSGGLNALRDLSGSYLVFPHCCVAFGVKMALKPRQYELNCCRERLVRL